MIVVREPDIESVVVTGGSVNVVGTRISEVTVTAASVEARQPSSGHAGRTTGQQGEIQYHHLPVDVTEMKMSDTEVDVTVSVTGPSVMVVRLPDIDVVIVSGGAVVTLITISVETEVSIAVVVMDSVTESVNVLK
jgi:hypothetical protein